MIYGSGMRSSLLLFSLAACGDNASIPSVDAPSTPSVSYRLVAVPSEPADRPPPDVKPQVFIDGVETAELVKIYPDIAAAIADVHRVELRYGTTVIAARDAGPSATSCMPNDAITEYRQGLCEFDSGDLRFGSETITGTQGVCVGDGFCLSGCNCGATERCTSRIVSTTPLASHLGCAPIGPRTLGQTCTLIADPAGAFDDCGAKLLCVGGTCAVTCDPRMGSDPCVTGTCSFVPGHAPDIGVCR